MIPGTTLHLGCEVLTEWVPRQGDNLIVQCEVIQIENSAKLEVEIYTKNATTVGNGTAVGSTGSFDTEDRHALSFEYSPGSGDPGLNDLVRLHIKVVDNGGTAGSPEWIRCRILDLIWYDTARA